MAKLIFTEENVRRFTEVINESKNLTEAFLTLSEEYMVTPSTIHTFYNFIDKSGIIPKRNGKRINWTPEIDRMILQTVCDNPGRYTAAFYELADTLQISDKTIKYRYYTKLRHQEIKGTNILFTVANFTNLRKNNTHVMINQKNTPKPFDEGMSL